MMNIVVASLFLLLAAQHEAQAFLPTSSPRAAHTSELEAHDRRGFVTGGIAAMSSLLLPQALPANAADVDYKAVAKDIMDLVEKNPDWGPSKSMPVGWF